MPLAGFLVAQQKLNFVYVILSGLVGFLISILPWYFAGRYLGEKGIKQLLYHHRRWLTVSTNSLDKMNRWFKRRGQPAVFLALLIPGTRNIVAISAGISGMSQTSFLLISTLGATLWLILLTAAGYYLGDRYQLVGEYIRQYIGPAYHIVIFGLLIALLIWAIKRYLKAQSRA